MNIDSKGMKNIKEAKTNVESALNDVTKLTASNDSNRLQIDYYCDHVLVRV